MSDAGEPRLRLRTAAIALAFAWGLAAAPEAPMPFPARPPGEGIARLLWGGRLDVNRAPPDALRALPGIGPRRATDLVAGRPYCLVDEIRRVRGIGPVTVARVRDSLEVRDRPMGCGRSAVPSR